jgi:HlyD family secretion protein
MLTLLAVTENVTGGTDLRVPDFRRRGLRRRALLAGAVALVAVIALLAWWRRPPPPLPYRIEEVQVRDLTHMVEVSGFLDAPETVDVPAPVAGRLVDIAVEPGARVAKGDPLAKLDERAAAVAVRGARARLEAATSQVAQARATLSAARNAASRVGRLAEGGLASEAEQSEAQARLEEAEAGLQAAQAARSAAREELAAAELTAELGELVSPMDGVVLEAPERLGAVAGPERGPLFVIGTTLDELIIAADLGEADVGDVREGQEARFDVPAYPGRSFEARVERVGLAARRQEGAVVYPLTLRAPNADGLLRPGMSASVRVLVGRAEQVLSVPEAALRFTPPEVPQAPTRSRVWKVVERTLEPVEVEPGLAGGVFTEVRPEDPEALRPGDRVAVGMAAPPGAGGPGIRLGEGSR